MELKDVILSTIAELGEETQKSTGSEVETKKRFEAEPEKEEQTLPKESDEKPVDLTAAARPLDDELEFLKNLRERLLVLFEGFQSPNNKRVEAKIELTLNFLEYLLAMLDERIDLLKKP
ncbi:CiaD-like domain-containing protein [Hydrogenimonas sp.]